MPFYSNAVFRFGLTPDVAARYTLLQNVRLRPVRMRLANGARDRRRLERLAIGRLGIAGELAIGVDFGDVGNFEWGLGTGVAIAYSQPGLELNSSTPSSYCPCRATLARESSTLIRLLAAGGIRFEAAPPLRLA